MLLETIDRLFYGFYRLMTIQPWGGKDHVRASMVFGTFLAFNLLTVLDLVAAVLRFDYEPYAKLAVVHLSLFPFCILFLLLRYSQPGILRRVLQEGNQRTASTTGLGIRLALLYGLCSTVLVFAAVSLAHEALH